MSKAVVIGGGLVGMLTAYELVSAGWQVELLERGEVARESTWAGGGILSPLYPWRYADPITELARWSQARYPELVRELKELGGVDPEWTLSGLLMLDMTDREAAYAWAERFGYRLEELSGKALNQCEPSLSHTYTQALWMENVAQVRNPRLAQSLNRSLLKLGVKVHEQSPVTSLVSQGGRISGVVSAGKEVGADVVVLAAGSWSGSLLAEFGLLPRTSFDIHPVRGQMLLFKGRPGAISRIVLGEKHYVIPRRDGRVLVGSTMEEVGFDKAPTPEARDELLEAAYRLVPLLAEAPLERQWAGLRPGSPKGVPYIGEHPDIKGLFVNSGHFRNGVVMGPASARLVAEMIQGKETILAAGPYSL